MNFGNKNFFLIGMFLAVALAKSIPSLGVNGSILRPELSIGKYGVGLIFLLSGLSLRGSELSKAVSNVKLNGLIQVAIFAAWPFLIGIPLKAVLSQVNLVPSALIDGLLILTCLPTTVNMCIMLTSSSGGDVAAAICNAVISNMAGIFVTPALLFYFFGANIKLPFVEMVLKLCKKVLLPVAIGQGLRATKAKDIYEKNSKGFKRLQEVGFSELCFPLSYSSTVSNGQPLPLFVSGLGLDAKHSVALLAILPTLHLGSLGALFKVFSLPLFQLSRPEIVAAMFCASQKTLAFGLPLINTVFEGNPNLASFVAPLMFIHPLQMTLGSLLLPRIRKYTSFEEDDE
eukprot:scaffold1514_cov118-Cylindrotheca_fusiformis.AAC.1